MNANALKRHLRLLALKAVPEIERRALEWLANHGKTQFGDKRKAALAYIKDQYARSTRNVPGLNATTLDDELFAREAERALDWAWAQLEGLIHDTSRGPVTDDTTLPAGGPQ